MRARGTRVFRLDDFRLHPRLSLLAGSDELFVTPLLFAGDARLVENRYTRDVRPVSTKIVSARSRRVAGVPSRPW